MKTAFRSALAMGALVSCLSASAARGAAGPDEDLKRRMAGYYRPVPVQAVKAVTPETPFPLDLNKLANWSEAGSHLPEAARALLARNGFVVADTFKGEKVSAFYKLIKQRGLPVFITSDSLLHLYHVQFDETLRRIEETAFFDDLTALTQVLRQESRRSYQSSKGLRKEAFRRCLGYFSVAGALLAYDETAAQARDALDWARKKPREGMMGRHAGFILDREYPAAARALREKGLFRFGPGIRNKDLVRALERLVVGMRSSVPVPHKAVADDVRRELQLIEAHVGFAPSPIFRYKEDYSQYVPRGHYTRSEKLKRFFKAMMWYGRMTFLIKGRTEKIRNALVSDEEARIQSLAAGQITNMLNRLRLGDGRRAKGIWARMYAVTAYYVGFSDDLTPAEYRRAVLGLPHKKLMMPTGGVDVAATMERRWLEMRAALAGMRSPRIYGGTGDMEGPPPQIATESDLDEALEATKGMRFMGQRYVPDSYMMGRLVYPTVGAFRGRGRPFTLSMSQAGPVRGFPRGLDVMAVLGSARAREIVKELGDDAYQRYDETLAKLRSEFASVSDEDWNRNMYWSWLHCLRGLLAPVPRGYPSFMRNTAWTDKQLNAALGSWAQLRHDTILYAKQSYTMRATGMAPRPKMVEGYVEPVPEFYARLLALTRMTLAGLDDMKVLDDQSRGRLKSLERIIARLLDIAVRELRNERLSREDYDFIRSFGDRLKGATAGAADKGLETTIVADVHTDGNSQQVLEEGTGALRTIAAAYPMPSGDIVVGFGPVFSYYEFKQPMSNRLTDEAWKALLRSPNAPPLPEWTASFSVGEN